MNSARDAFPTLAASLGFLAATGAILFGGAGRLDVGAFRAYLAVWALGSTVAACLIDPTLAEERLRPGPGGQDYSSAAAAGLLWVAQHLVAGLDVGRFHWSDGVPAGVQVLGLVAFAGGLATSVWAMVVNRGIALGSWLATAIGALIVPPLLRRTAREDRLLRERLDGYAAYAERVRYRVLPGVW